MNRHQQKVVLLFGLLLITAAMIGCANDNNRVAGAYEQDLARARASIAEAEQVGAARYGSAELASARDKLRAANEAVEDGELETARRLAVEADLDADLAAAMTRNQETQELVSEVRAGLRTLEDELQRNQSSGVERQ